MNVTEKTLNRIMNEIDSLENIETELFAYYTDIINDDCHIVRAYDDVKNRMLFVYITKNGRAYKYTYKFVEGEKPHAY